MVIGALMNNYGAGILIFSLLYLIAFIVLLLNQKKIRSYIMRKIIEFQLNEKDENDHVED
jgi:hypothetical protein